MLLTGDIISGADAKELRLVSQTAPDADSCKKAAMELAQRIASQAPVAVRATVRSLRIKQDEGLDKALWRRLTLSHTVTVLRIAVKGSKPLQQRESQGS